MDIYKALKLEKRGNKRFYRFMVLNALILPISLWLTNIRKIYLYVFLVIIELLIVLSILKRIDFKRLNYEYINNKIRFKNGLFTKSRLIICDKVKIVHTNNMEEDLEIIIVSSNSCNIRSGKLKSINKKFLSKYPEISEEYSKLKRIYPNDYYYFQIIKKGGFKKYIFLNDIYRYCVKAIYTESSILSIKIARGETL